MKHSRQAELPHLPFPCTPSAGWLEKLRRIHPDLPDPIGYQADAYVRVIVALNRALRDVRRTRKACRVVSKLGYWPRYDPTDPSLLLLNLVTLRWASSFKGYRVCTKTLLWRALTGNAKTLPPKSSLATPRPRKEPTACPASQPSA